MMNLHVEIEHLVEIEGVDSRNGHAQRIADKVAHVMVFENLWTFGKQGALVGLLHVGLQGHQSFFAGFVQEVVHHLQRVNISLLVVLRAAEYCAKARPNLLENMNGISDEHSTDRRSQDGDEFGRLDEHFQIPVLHEIAADYTAENNDDADDCKHGLDRGIF